MGCLEWQVIKRNRPSMSLFDQGRVNGRGRCELWKVIVGCMTGGTVQAETICLHKYFLFW